MPSAPAHCWAYCALHVRFWMRYSGHTYDNLLCQESSGRVVAWRQFTNRSYTLEASFGGADDQVLHRTLSVFRCSCLFLLRAYK